jgi:hypothetical protein
LDKKTITEQLEKKKELEPYQKDFILNSDAVKKMA